ncbi:F-box/kelch-repeat protein At5g26960-like [Prosopis cineraria]|uniref:F-box/kelch-repeat protein At5g26960-like n=1 Tax=Prosopis cineraria TaxID=364024 RepID=UPI00240FF2AF|nr:F-box/kelch-repeat protein At5g26960-like [Prosopis cineraria]
MSSERERCNSRHFTWIMKTCFPNPHQTTTICPQPYHPTTTLPITTTTITSLPDDVVLECLCRVPPSSLPSLSLVCRRWARLLHSSHFSDLRRRRSLLHHSVFAVVATDSGFCAASLTDGAWKIALFHPCYDAVALDDFHFLLAHARLASIGPRIFVIGRNAMVRYDTWTSTLSPRSAMNFPRKKFASAVVSGKIYVAGGGSRSTAVEEYDPDSDTWSVVSYAQRRRYGCIGVSVDGLFFIIGGLRIGAAGEGNEFSRATGGADAHAAYASSMDLFDVEARTWLRSRTVPGGGCVVAACAAAGNVYVLTSHAVELSFWKFDARRKSSNHGGGGGFGDWCRIKSPPFPVQVRVDTRMRFSCIGLGDKVVLIQVNGWCVDEMMRSGRSVREGMVLIYDCGSGEWRRGADLPDLFRRAAYVGVEC